jgi:predicted RNase H-like nuclease (RuvC/YqgF family)
MRVKVWIRASIFLPVLCLTAFALVAHAQSPSQQTGDPVADAARKAREAKKDAPKPKKVYTDDDVKTTEPAPAPPTAPASGFAQATAGQAAKPAADDDKDPNSEKAWRKRFKDQHDKIDKAEKELDILQRELEKAQVEYYPDPQKAMTQQNTRGDINALTAKVAAKKDEIAGLKQGLDDLEDQLRKSGGDPGWAR